MIDKELLSEYLTTINEQYDTKTARDAVETLLKIYRNIFHNEGNVQKKYRIIKPENQTFSRKIWSLYPCRQFMILSGWMEVHGQLVFNSDENLLDTIDLLIHHRNVTPSATEWVESSKHEGKSEDQLREEHLKKKAAIQRQKEIEEFMKDKKYREELAENIKAQIISDRAKSRPMFTNPVVGNKLVKGAKIKTLRSGCDSGCK